MPAFLYVRRSVMLADPTRTLSPQVQEDRCRALALAHGDADVVVLSDLDVSGAKTAERPGYQRLVQAIESGEASSVVAYDLSRLHRNVREALRFFEAARDHDVPVRLVMDSVDTSTATGRMVLTILAAVNAMVSEQTSEKVRATNAVRRARGDVMGGKFYGTAPGHDPGAVVAAFKDAGSALGAARLLNQHGVPTRNRASKGWSPTSVRSVLRRVAPDQVAPGTHPGSRSGARSTRLARLLFCGTCHSMLSPTHDRSGQVRYVCHHGSTLPHPRTSITERKVWPAVDAEVEHARLAIRRVRAGSRKDEAKLEALAAKRLRIGENYNDGVYDKAERDRRLAEVAKAEAGLTARRWVMQFTMPADVERDRPEVVNNYLRRLWDRVDLDPVTFQPARFEWRDPSLRA